MTHHRGDQTLGFNLSDDPVLCSVSTFRRRLRVSPTRVDRAGGHRDGEYLPPPSSFPTETSTPETG